MKTQKKIKASEPEVVGFSLDVNSSRETSIGLNHLSEEKKELLSRVTLDLRLEVEGTVNEAEVIKLAIKKLQAAL